MPNTNLISDLKRSFLFSRLNEEQLEEVAGKARKVLLPERASLFDQGDPAGRFFLLLRGQIKLYRLSPDGNEKVIEFVQPGQTFAEAIMFLEKHNYPVSAMALSDAELISIDSAAFAALLRDSMDTCFLVMADMSQRLRGLIREIDDLSLHSATCRVSAYLVSKLIEQVDSQEFHLTVPKSLLASRLSVKPETFSRILKGLITNGVISVDGDKVTVHDEAQLKERADLSGSSDRVSIIPSGGCGAS